MLYVIQVVFEQRKKKAERGDEEKERGKRREKGKVSCKSKI